MDLDDVITRINSMSLDGPQLVITSDGKTYTITEGWTAGDPYASDIDSSYEIPDTADEHGKRAFSAGPWTAYQYHPSYTGVHRANFEDELADLAAGDLTRVIVDCTATDDTWVFAIRTE